MKHVFGLWEEAELPGENPRKFQENLETSTQKRPSGILTSRCEVRELQQYHFKHLLQIILGMQT